MLLSFYLILIYYIRYETQHIAASNSLSHDFYFPQIETAIVTSVLYTHKVH